jgi:hypothetical protein
MNGADYGILLGEKDMKKYTLFYSAPCAYLITVLVSKGIKSVVGAVLMYTYSSKRLENIQKKIWTNQ